MSRKGIPFKIFANEQRAVVILIILLLLAHTVIGAMSPLDYWSWVNPGINGVPIYSIAYGNGKYVAVGDCGTILTSPDGVHWRNKSLSISDPLGAVGFGNGVFVLYLLQAPSSPVGNAYTFLLTSSDGENWDFVFSESHSSVYGRTEYIRQILFADGRFVAVGGNDSDFPDEKTRWILTSPDGTNWTSSVNSGLAFYAVTYADNRLVAVGDNGVSGVSSNGLDWEINTTNEFGYTSQWDDIVYFRGQFVALANTGWMHNASRIFCSSNGYSWTAAGADITGYAALDKLIPHEGKLLALGETGQVFISIDATNWSPYSLPVSARIYDAALLDGKPFLVGDKGLILSSTNGQPWTVFPASTGETVFQAMTFGGGRFVALGRTGFAVWSDDGKNWSSGMNSSSASMNSAIYTDGQFVAVGDDQTILVSSNGQSWQNVFSNPGVYNRLTDIAWNGSLFTAVGWSGYTVTSTNGRNWELHHPTNNYFYSVTAGNGLFVANQGIGVFTSTNGVDWTLRTNTGSTVLMNDGAYANGRFVLGGDRGATWTSTNGIGWTSNCVPYGFRLTRVIAAEGLFIAGGDGELIFSSTDGANWVEHLLPARNQIFGIAYGAGRVMVGGAAGMILQSDSLTQPLRTIRGIERLGSNRIRLDLQAAPGMTFQVQKSDTLKEWADQGVIYAPLGRAGYDLILGSTNKFFRALTAP